MSHVQFFDVYKQMLGSGEVSASTTRVGLRSTTPGRRLVGLPCAKEAFVAARGRPLLLKDEDGTAGNAISARVVIRARTGQTIDGEKEITITRARGVLEMYSDGENWQVIRNGAP